MLDGGTVPGEVVVDSFSGALLTRSGCQMYPTIIATAREDWSSEVMVRKDQAGCVNAAAALLGSHSLVVLCRGAIVYSGHVFGTNQVKRAPYGAQKHNVRTLLAVLVSE